MEGGLGFSKVRILFLIFLLSFFLNLIWENLHALLYISYRGGPITEFVLLHATFADAAFAAVFGFLFLEFEYLRNREWLIIIIGFIFAALVEIWGLNTGRWGYSLTMPIIPFLGTGLTPTIQLGLLTYLTFKIVGLKNKTL